MERRALTDMEEWERRSLAAFRAVAREVRESSIVTNGLTIRHWLVQTGDEVKLGIDLLPAEAFRSLCVSVRKVYMEKEPASFYKVYNIVARYDAGEYRKGAGKVRADYHLILDGQGVEFHIGGKVIPHEEFFDTWLNAYTFHQDAFEDPVKTGPYEAFTSLGMSPAVEAVVQKVALQLAGCVIEMDDVIADWLGEERLPRIAPPKQAQ